MLWKEIKKWAKDKGYKADRKKIENEENSYSYVWFKISDENISGTTTSVSKVATAIFNDLTNNKHIEYQKEYKEKEANKDIQHETEGW
jgi:hypothetical protein